MACEDDTVNYRKVAQTGITSALLDAVERRANPNAARVQYSVGLRLVETRDDPVAARMFAFAYHQATENPHPWARFRP